MSKYSPLGSHLELISGRNTVRMTFAEVEFLVGPLPRSARDHRAWWSNDSKVQARAWRRAGWHVDRVDQRAEWVEFAPGAVGGTHLTRSTASGTPAASTPTGGRDHAIWEGDVQTRLVDHLQAHHWSVLKQADTAKKSQGIDVVAERGGHTAAFEVKGFPSRTYSDPARAGQHKPTSPSTQARHWFGAAVLTAILTKSDHPDWSSVICLPDAPTYRNLARRTTGQLASAGVSLWFIRDDNTVESDAPLL